MYTETVSDAIGQKKPRLVPCCNCSKCLVPQFDLGIVGLPRVQSFMLLAYIDLGHATRQSVFSEVGTRGQPSSSMTLNHDANAAIQRTATRHRRPSAWGTRTPRQRPIRRLCVPLAARLH